MRILVCSLGTLGDALPFLALAKALQGRGHDVTLLGNGYYRDFVEREGLRQVNLISRKTFSQYLADASLWADADAYVLKRLPDALPVLCRRVYNTIARHGDPKDTVVVTHDYVFGARIAQEARGFRTATVHLQPAWMRSALDPPLVSPRTPTWLFRIMERFFDAELDKRVGGAVNGLRGELGLPPARGITKSWWNSPDLVLAMFPEWLGPPQSDWPARTVQTGFPFFESSSDRSFDASEVDAFLREGPPPLVFTQSSVTKDAEAFYGTGVEICRALGRRGILLTSHAEQVPKPLPDFMRHYRFVPMNWLLPRCALHVNHGGMGSAAWTLAAGIPQLNVPWGFDQLDTSRRLRRLGVADYVRPKRFSAKCAAKVRRLLEDASVAAQCRTYAARCRETDAMQIACEAIERLNGSPRAGEAVSGRFKP
jgi:UDP:flavonoid glycosyltransferase YjiC (YdhE family)